MNEKTISHTINSPVTIKVCLPATAPGIYHRTPHTTSFPLKINQLSPMQLKTVVAWCQWLVFPTCCCKARLAVVVVEVELSPVSLYLSLSRWTEHNTTSLHSQFPPLIRNKCWSHVTSNNSSCKHYYVEVNINNHYHSCTMYVCVSVQLKLYSFTLSHYYYYYSC